MRKISDPNYVYTPWSPERRAAARERELARLANLSREQREAQRTEQPPSTQSSTAPKAEKVTKPLLPLLEKEISVTREKIEHLKRQRDGVDREMYRLTIKMGALEKLFAEMTAEAIARGEQSAVTESNRGAARVESRETEGH